MQLELRPIYVRTEEHTRGHVLVVMLAYLIRRELSKAWTGLNVTVEEGLAQLTTLCSMEVKVEGRRQLPAHSVSAPRIQRPAHSDLGAGAGSAAPPSYSLVNYS